MKLKVDSDIELREIELSDASDIFNVIDSQRKYLGRWLPFVDKTKKVTDTKAFIESILETPIDSKEYTFTIRKQNELVGLISLKSTDIVNKKTEIGYWISEVYQKQGIVTKSVQRLCEFVFNDLELNRISIRCATENEASKRIPQRLGFKFDGIKRDAESVYENVFIDLEVYSKLKKDYFKSVTAK